MPVYFAQEGDFGPVKIGWAQDVRKRIGGLQTGNVRLIRAIRVLAGTPSHEVAIRRMYESLWIVGEWFHFSPDYLAADFGLVDLPVPNARTPRVFAVIQKKSLGDYEARQRRGEWSHHTDAAFAPARFIHARPDTADAA